MLLMNKYGEILLEVAKASIKQGLKQQSALVVNPLDYAHALREIRATFVTLNINHQLRGCIGTLTAHRPLVSDIAYHAYAAGFSDPRFPKLQDDEWTQLEIHISILSVPEPMTFDSESDLIQKIRPGIDGLILNDRGYQGTFLPSVWDSLTTPHAFISHLKQKAGLPANYWSSTLSVQRYTTESIAS